MFYTVRHLRIGLQRVVAAPILRAVHLVGLPEAQLILSEAALFIATCPKSNTSSVAIWKAMDDVENIRTGEPPMHLRNAVTDGMDKLGYGKGYLYAHNYENNYVPLQFLPDEVKDRVYYEPGDNRYEKQIAEHLAKIKQPPKP